MKTKILIVGIGGVGGYYGGLLARKYENHPEIEISFVARGAHLETIQQNGLKVITEDETFVTHPAIATNNIYEIGIADYIILATKSYDLASTIEQIKPCVGAETVILPLLNGADISERISRLLPRNEIWEGCVYIVGRLIEPGVVESSGGVHDLFFGLRNQTSEKLSFIEKILLDAGIKAHLTPEIGKIIWRKFIFISTTATLTSYFNVGFRDLLTDDYRKSITLKIIREVASIANAEGIEFDSDIVQSTLKLIERLPFGTTASMHSDFSAKKNTELETLTAIVIEMGKQHKVYTPTYQMVYDTLKK